MLMVGGWRHGGVTVRTGILLFKSLEFNAENGLEYGEKSSASFHCNSILARPSR